MFLTNLLKSTLTKQRCGKVAREDNIREITFRNVILEKKKKDLGSKNLMNGAAWNIWNLAYGRGE